VTLRSFLSREDLVPDSELSSHIISYSGVESEVNHHHYPCFKHTSQPHSLGKDSFSRQLRFGGCCCLDIEEGVELTLTEDDDDDVGTEVVGEEA
jgi:hypothetical protein